MIKVGLIVDDGVVNELVYDLIKKSKSSSNYEVATFVVQSNRAQNVSSFKRSIQYIKQKGLKKFISRLSWALVCRIDQLALKKSEKFKNHTRNYHLDNIEIQKIYVNPKISKSGYAHRFDDDDLVKLKNEQLDVLVGCGSGILRGDILSICAFGVISFHHANNDMNRGGPPGFWEVFNREKSTGFIIQRLLEELDGGDVIFQGRIATVPIYSLNQAILFRKANFFMHKVLDDLGRKEELPLIKNKKPYAFPLYTMPTIREQLSYIFLKTVPFVFRKLLDKFILMKSWRWGVAYQFVENWKSAVLWRSKVIKNPPNRYLADPFIWKKDGTTVCYVEDYDYKIGKGHISAYKLERGGYTALGTVLSEKFHLSYPFIFDCEGDLYMCPETNESGDIRLYKCVNFPTGWIYHKTLIDNVNTVDTNIFRYDSKWWLFTNIDSSDLGDYGSELHIFYSDSMDSDEWIPHSKNPVIFNSECARNGGLIIEEGAIFRVYQRQGFGMYGESMGVAMIEKLTEDDYKEVQIFDIPPKFFRGIGGTHTFSYKGGVLALDFVKRERYSV